MGSRQERFTVVFLSFTHTYFHQNFLKLYQTSLNLPHSLPNLLTLENNAHKDKRRVSPGIEPGTTRNIDLEFPRIALLQILPKRVSYR
jgi:hypothetical protein